MVQAVLRTTPLETLPASTLRSLAYLVVPKARVVPGQERLAEVGGLLHPASGDARPHHPRRRGRHVPLPLLVLLVLDLEALVFDLLWMCDT